MIARRIALRGAIGLFLAVGMIAAARPAFAQNQIQLRGIKVDGKITGVKPGFVEITAGNTKWVVNMEGKLGPMVQLNTPPKIAVKGTANPKILAAGQSIKFSTDVDKRNHIHGDVFAIDLFVPTADTLYGIFPREAPGGGLPGPGGGDAPAKGGKVEGTNPFRNEGKEDPKPIGKADAKPDPKAAADAKINPKAGGDLKPPAGVKPVVETVPADVVARITGVRGDTISIQIPNGTDKIKLAEACIINFETNDYSICKIGDPVTGTIGYAQPPNAVAVDLTVNVTMAQEQENPRNKRNGPGDKKPAADKPSLEKPALEKPAKGLPELKKPLGDAKQPAADPANPPVLKLERQGEKDK